MTPVPVDSPTAAEDTPFRLCLEGAADAGNRLAVEAAADA